MVVKFFVLHECLLSRKIKDNVTMVNMIFKATQVYMVFVLFYFVFFYLNPVYLIFFLSNLVFDKIKGWFFSQGERLKVNGPVNNQPLRFWWNFSAQTLKIWKNVLSLLIKSKAKKALENGSLRTWFLTKLEIFYFFTVINKRLRK